MLPFFIKLINGNFTLAVYVSLESGYALASSVVATTFPIEFVQSKKNPLLVIMESGKGSPIQEVPSARASMSLQSFTVTITSSFCMPLPVKKVMSSIANSCPSVTLETSATVIVADVSPGPEHHVASIVSQRQ